MSDSDDLTQKIREVKRHLDREEHYLSTGPEDAVIAAYGVQSLRKVLRQLEAEHAAVAEDPCSRKNSPEVGQTVIHVVQGSRDTDAAP